MSFNVKMVKFLEFYVLKSKNFLSLGGKKAKYFWKKC